MKLRAANIAKSAFIVVVSIILATVGINAADNAGNLSQSLVGRMIGLESENACPEDMVLTQSPEGSFCIDVYEASVGNGCPHASPLSTRETQLNLDQPDCKPVSVVGQEPWRNVTQSQAQLACAKAGKRLAASGEWYRAAIGTPDPSVPTDSLCIIGRTGASDPDKTGSMRNCISSSGAHDMIGNVWEWVDGNIVGGKHGELVMPQEGYVTGIDSNGIPFETNSEFPDANFNEDYLWIGHDGVRGMFRGGYWGSDERAGVYALFAFSPPTFSGNAVGFRCVSDSSL